MLELPSSVCVCVCVWQGRGWWKMHLQEGSWRGPALGYCASAAPAGTRSHVHSQAAPALVPAPREAASSCPELRAVPRSEWLDRLCEGVRQAGSVGAGSLAGIESCWGRKRL